MKLMLVGYVGGVGGAERVLINLANAMSDRGHDVYLVSIVANNPKYKISDRVKYKLVEERGSNRLTHLINRYLQLKSYIKELQPDLIMCNMRHPAFFCAFMGKDTAEKTIYAERCDPFASEYHGLLGVIRYISFKRLKGFVFQSEAARSCFGSDIKKRSCIIQNTVSVGDIVAVDSSMADRRIVSVGRLHEQKNQTLLIDAFSMLPDDKNDYTLEIYGEGPLRHTLQKKIDSMNLSDRVFLMGAFPNVHQRIASAKIFVLSSDFEGMPNALIEAMAMGLPCISTDYSPGSACEFIHDGENGLITPRGDAGALTAAMNKLLDDAELRRGIGKRAKEIKNKLAPDRIYDEWEQFFYTMVGSHAS